MKRCIVRKDQPTICIAGHRFISQKQGGVELQTWYIGKILAEAGWKVAFLSPNLDGRQHLERVCEGMEVQWYPHFSFSFQAPVRLLQAILDSVQPDVFYQRGRGQLTNNSFVLNYAKNRGIPTVFALSSDADLDPVHELKSNLYSSRPLWKKGLLMPYCGWLDYSFDRVVKGADCLIAQHEGQAAGIETKFNKRASILRSLHPEIDHPARKAATRPILWVNNYKPLKQGEIFVQLARELTAYDCHFVMVCGKTKEEYVRPIIELARDVRNMEITGELPLSEVGALLENAILFVNTSAYEGFPNTFVQSWLRETPTVSLNVDPGGILERERIGFCSGSFEKLVADVTLLLENDKERQEMGQRARKYAEREHGLDRNAGKIVEFFNRVARRDTSETAVEPRRSGRSLVQ